MKEYGVRKTNKGITIMALVITVIVLLILAGIGVATLSGDNGIINRSRNAKDSAAVKSEMRIVEVASNTARGKNKYGKVKKETLEKELDITVGSGKTEVTPYPSEDNALYFLVTFIETNRVYEVDNEEGLRYLGAIGDEVTTGILIANPKRDKTPKRNRTINLSLVTIEEVETSKINIKYAWSKSITNELGDDKFESIPQGDINKDPNDSKVNSTEVSTNDLDDGKWYLHVIARINNGEEIKAVFGDYAVGDE